MPRPQIREGNTLAEGWLSKGSFNLDTEVSGGSGPMQLEWGQMQLEWDPMQLDWDPKRLERDPKRSGERSDAAGV